MQKFIQRFHDCRVTVDLIRAVLFDQKNTFLFDVARDDSRKSLTQIDRQFVWWQVAAQLQVGHVGVRRVKWALEPFIDFQ